MATHAYYKLQQGSIPSIKPGSNWFWIRIDWTLEPGAINDDYQICEVKNHWVLKSGFTRTDATAGAATANIDIGTSAGGNQIDDAVDIDGADTMTRFDTLDDDGPIAITADGFLYVRLLTAAAGSGWTDIFIEVVVPHTNVEDVDSLGS